MCSNVHFIPYVRHILTKTIPVVVNNLPFRKAFNVLQPAVQHEFLIIAHAVHAKRMCRNKAETHKRF